MSEWTYLVRGTLVFSLAHSDFLRRGSSGMLRGWNVGVDGSVREVLRHSRPLHSHSLAQGTLFGDGYWDYLKGEEGAPVEGPEGAQLKVLRF